jgi:hypothetical protein
MSQSVSTQKTSVHARHSSHVAKRACSSADGTKAIFSQHWAKAIAFCIQMKHQKCLRGHDGGGGIPEP